MLAVVRQLFCQTCSVSHRSMRRHCSVFCLFFQLLFLYGVLEGPREVHSVKINRLQVPEIAQMGESVVLDCDYTLDQSDDEGLVIKWFFNERPTPIYQWIPDKRPQDVGILKGRLNLNYSASKDANSVHRALHILSTSPELSGNYTCFVSTFSSEDRQTKRMLVLVPEKTLELRREYIGDNKYQLMCYAERVFPRPTMSLHIGGSEVNNSKVEVYEKGNIYDIKITAELPRLESPEEFSCELHIPQANYTVRKEAIYYPVNGGTMLQENLSSMAIKSMMVICYHLLLFTG